VSRIEAGHHNLEELTMRLYCGIDLHSNNHVITILDEADRRVFERRVANDLALTRAALAPFREHLVGVAVESTFNWYWLVDGLMESGYRLHLVNTAAVQKYSGLKHCDDRHDARWLAHLLRHGILPTGYIYPKEQRAVRELARQRGRLVQLRSAQVTALQTQIWRVTGEKLAARILKSEADEGWPALNYEEQRIGVQSARRVIATLNDEVESLEQRLLQRVKLAQPFQVLRTVNGVGEILALTIMLEVGDIDRFQNVGQFASYCRCVESIHSSNGKRKGEGNRRNGNPHLAWAFHEAAHFAIRYLPAAQRFYQRKARERNAIVAMKALAHKLARACYYVLRDNVAFEPDRLFSH
jgi:transposase